MPQAFIAAADPASKVAAIFTNADALVAAIQQGYIPLRIDGTAYITQTFDNTVLLDGVPINVLYSGFWQPGQKDTLAPHWAVDVPKPPADMIALPESSTPAVLPAEVGASSPAPAGATIAGIPKTWVVIGAAGLALWWLFGD